MLRNARNGCARLSGFTLVELLVVIAIVAALAALLLPALSRAKASSKSAACKSNLRQLGLALNMYVDDHLAYPGRPRYSNNLFGTLPVEPLDKVLYQLAPYLRSGGNRPGDIELLSHRLLVWNCPSADRTNVLELYGPSRVSRHVPSYGYNRRGTLRETATFSEEVDLGLSPRVVASLPSGEVLSPVAMREIRPSDISVPSEMIAFGDDSWPSWTIDEISPFRPLVGDRHNRGANVVFCDSHVEFARQAKWIAATEPAYRRWNNDNRPHPETW